MKNNIKKEDIKSLTQSKKNYVKISNLNRKESNSIFKN